MINFAEFSVQKSANERASLAGVKRGQNFNFKFRKFNSAKGGEEKIETIYTLSNAKFAELGLDNYGIVQIVSPDGKPYIAVVSNDEATMLKRTDKLAADAPKGKKFKSTILDKALIAAGILEDVTDKTQSLDLVKVEGSDNAPLAGGKVAVGGVYEIVKGADIVEDEDETPETEVPAEMGAVDGSTVNTPVEETPVTTAPQAEATKNNVEDDF